MWIDVHEMTGLLATCATYFSLIAVTSKPFCLTKVTRVETNGFTYAIQIFSLDVMLTHIKLHIILLS